MSPDERVYCGDPFCDGDHVSANQNCVYVPEQFDLDDDAVNPDQ